MLASPLIFYLGVVALTFVVALYAHVQKIQSRLSLARGKIASGSKAELEDAEALLENVIQKSVRLADRQTRADTFNDLGVCQLLLKKSQDAAQSFRSSLGLRSRANVQQYVKTLENLGSALRDAGDYDHAISTYREALATVRSSEPYQKSSILSNLGVAYRDKKDFVGLQAESGCCDLRHTGVAGWVISITSSSPTSPAIPSHP
jgi:tetratricopeptide (TPR) repeat protein